MKKMDKLSIISNAVLIGAGDNFVSYNLPYRGMTILIEVQFDNNEFNGVILWNDVDSDDVDMDVLDSDIHKELYDAILELAKADFKGMLDDEISKDMEDESAVILNVNFYIPLHGDDIGNIILQFKEDMDECGYTFDILETRLEED